MSESDALPPHTTDSFLGGKVRLVQPKKGHRAGLDAALLQALIPAEASGLLIELGAGVGTVAFSAAARAPRITAAAVERNPDLVRLAHEALQLSENAGFAARVQLLAADANDRSAIRRLLGQHARADWALMNPPFDTPGRVRESPDPDRRDAHVGGLELLRDWCRTASALLKPGGMLGIIHRADAMPALLEATADAFGGISVLPAHPSAHAAASRVVVKAEKGSRAPLRLLPPLVLHGAGGTWTEEADAILRGRAALSM